MYLYFQDKIKMKQQHANLVIANVLNVLDRQIYVLFALKAHTCKIIHVFLIAQADIIITRAHFHAYYAVIHVLHALQLYIALLATKHH